MQTATWTYDVYGTRTQTSGTLSYAFGFTGREHDVDTGLIYSRQRYYDPSVGGGTQPDRKGDINGPNFYAYVMDRATLMSDPFGDDAEVIIFAPTGYGESSFGHLAVRIDSSVYTFAPKDTAVEVLDFQGYMQSVVPTRTRYAATEPTEPEK